MIDTIVFDFDGTLAELHLDFVDMKRRIARLAATFLSPPPVSGHLPALEWLKQLEAAMDASAARKFDAAAHRLILEMELEAARRGKLFPFTRRLLRELASQQVKTAIITRNCTQAVTAVFPDRDRYCPCLLTRDDVERVKPDPRHLLTALERLDSTPQHALMVGDHPLDIETGRRAGTYTGAVASGHTTRATLETHAPDWIASDCDLLIRSLQTAHWLRTEPLQEI